MDKMTLSMTIELRNCCFDKTLKFQAVWRENGSVVRELWVNITHIFLLKIYILAILMTFAVTHNRLSLGQQKQTLKIKEKLKLKLRKKGKMPIGENREQRKGKLHLSLIQERKYSL